VQIIDLSIIQSHIHRHNGVCADGYDDFRMRQYVTVELVS